MARRRRLLTVAAGGLGVVVLAMAVTAFTGLPAPGPLRRYRAEDLRALVDAVHAEAGALRTPDDCWQLLEPGPPTDDRRPVASIDWVRSRVVVAVRADNVGRVDGRTRRAVDSRLRAIADADPDLTMGMVEVEASPEGWSPLMSCGLVLQGRAAS